MNMYGSILLGLLVLPSYAQVVDNISFANSLPIDPDRYAEVRGSAYLMADWTPAILVDREGLVYPDLQANYNGYEQEIEIRSGDRYIALDEVMFRDFRALIFVQGEDSLRLIPNGKKALGVPWVIAVYEGSSYTLLASFRVVKSEREIHTVGKTMLVQQFKHDQNYYLTQGAETTRLKMRRRKLLAQLGHAKQVKAFVRRQGLKLNSEAGLKAVLAYLEAQGLH